MWDCRAVLVGVVLSTIVAAQGEAAPRKAAPSRLSPVKSVRSMVLREARLQRQIGSATTALTQRQRDALLLLLITLPDSDGDRVPDVLESALGTPVCMPNVSDDFGAPTSSPGIVTDQLPSGAVASGSAGVQSVGATTMTLSSSSQGTAVGSFTEAGQGQSTTSGGSVSPSRDSVSTFTSSASPAANGTNQSLTLGGASSQSPQLFGVVSGVITSVSNTGVAINGQSFLLAPQSQFFDGNGNQPGFGVLGAGQCVVATVGVDRSGVFTGVLGALYVRTLRLAYAPNCVGFGLNTTTQSSLFPTFSDLGGNGILGVGSSLQP